MLTYLVTAEGIDPIMGFLGSWGTPLRDRIAVRTYEEVAQRDSLPACNYIFSDLERLSDAGLARADRLWTRLHEGGPSLRLLNRPAAHLRRGELLRRLSRAHVNDFTAYRPADAVRADLRFPVFLRYENEHWGPMTGLLTNRRRLLAALLRARALGHRTDDLLVVEFCDTRGSDGAYRKAGAFVFGDRILPRHLMHSSGWMVRDFDRVDVSTIAEEGRYLADNPHGEELRKVATIAGTDYARIDYAIVDGSLRVWELNTNPVVMEPPGKYLPEHLPLQRQFAATILQAFERLAEPHEPAGEIALDPDWAREPWPSRPRRRAGRRLRAARRTQAAARSTRNAAAGVLTR